MGVHAPVYLDAHATTPCDPRVAGAMLPCLTGTFGNPSSRSHAFGWQAEALVERAREQVAALLACNPREVIFTSGATESDNLAIAGSARARGGARGHVVTGMTEHKAVLDPCVRLTEEGFTVTRLKPLADGRITAEAVGRALTAETFLVSIMAANNETGVLNPIADIGRLCKERGVLFHCDAVQALAHLPCAVDDLGVDLLSVSAHKMYGPKGVGALYLRRRDPRARVEPLMLGGGQERGLRPGTLNVPGVVGLGLTCELALDERDSDALRIASLRDALLRKLMAAIPDALVNGSMEHRLPNHLGIAIPGVSADALMAAMPDLAISSGSACTSESMEPSHVLTAMGFDAGHAHSSIRFGLTRFTTAEEIDFAASTVIGAVAKLR